jgi:hypothetical protein
VCFEVLFLSLEVLFASVFNSIVTVLAEIVYLYARRSQEDFCAFTTKILPTFGPTSSDTATIWLDPSLQVGSLKVILPSLDHDMTVGNRQRQWSAQQ